MGGDGGNAVTMYNISSDLYVCLEQSSLGSCTFLGTLAKWMALCSYFCRVGLVLLTGCVSVDLGCSIDREFLML